ncbi:hypothetical protein [Streptomyces sp. 2P-4]|uniref:hypothetical protein n=1 Tax=Streptomyces sp. 2P-4 TaxID=2931974 RepID=UPI0025409AEE|nr:hypothetical protein [Streptomyces sp. 2P-4]
MTTITTGAAQVGEGRTPHYIRTDGFHAKTLCNRMSSRLFTDAQVAKLGNFCRACVKALAELNAPAVEAPAVETVDAPAAETAESTPAPAPAVHHFDSTEEAYNATQCRDDIDDGDVLVIETAGVVGFLRSAWPGAITTAHGELHTFTASARSIDDGKYAASVDLAEQIANEHGFEVNELHATPAPAVEDTPAAPVTFEQGDRVLCVDGLARTVKYVDVVDGRRWVHTTDYSAWLAKDSVRIDDSRVPAARETALSAAAAIRNGGETPDPEAVAELGAALRYLRHADPAAHADLIADAPRRTIRVMRADVAPGDVLQEQGPHTVLDVCMTGEDTEDARWWAKILGATKDVRAYTGRKPWNTALRLDLARTDEVTVQRPLPTAPATDQDTADTTVPEDMPAPAPVDPTSPEFAPFPSYKAPERFHADVETRLAFPGHNEDRITIHQTGRPDALHYIALPHVAERTAATVLGALGWELVDGLEYIASMNMERGQVRRTEPTTGPEADELRAALLRHTVARATALADHSGARHFRAVMPADGGPYPIGWTYRTTGYGDACAFGWVTAQGRGMNRVGVPTREEAEAIVLDWHATGQDSPTHTGMVDVLTDLPAREIGAVSVVLRGATERVDGPVQTVTAAQEAVTGFYPAADSFEPVTTQDGLLGFTFQVGRLHSARYGWVTRFGTYGKSLERYRSHASAMLPAQVADDQRAAGLDVPAPAPLPFATGGPTPTPEGTVCVHGHTERPGDPTRPAAVCDAKASADTVGVFSDEGCVDARDCAVQAAQIAHDLNHEDETAREALDADTPLYRWAVVCPDHEEQPAIGCEDCATDDQGDEGDEVEPEQDTEQDAGMEQPVTFAAGDRVVCADGVARTVKGMAPAVTGEPARVVDEDGAEWIAANCLPANPSDVGTARDACAGAAARVRELDTQSPEWREALAELGRQLDYLKAADPITRAALVQDDAETAARALHADANGFTGIYPDGAAAPVAWSFRVGTGDGARYGVVTVDCQVAPIGLYEYRTTAERAFLHGAMPANG